MANGEEHAKRTIMIQVDQIKEKLSNVHRADPETHGAALLLLLQIMEPIFTAKLVTLEQCRATHKRRFGWPAAVTAITVAGMLCGLAIKLST